MRKWSTAIVKEKTEERALSGNALTLRYVPSVTRLHIIVYLLKVYPNHGQVTANLCEYRYFCVIYLN